MLETSVSFDHYQQPIAPETLNNLSQTIGYAQSLLPDLGINPISYSQIDRLVPQTLGELFTHAKQVASFEWYYFLNPDIIFAGSPKPTANDIRDAGSNVEIFLARALQYEQLLLNQGIRTIGGSYYFLGYGTDISDWIQTHVEEDDNEFNTTNQAIMMLISPTQACIRSVKLLQQLLKIT